MIRKRIAVALAAFVWLSPAWAQSNIIGSGITGDVKAASGACSQATNFLARTSGLSTTERNAYITMICGLVTDGIITGSMSGSGSGATACGSLLDAFYILATNTTTTAALNLCSTTYSLTTTGSPTFTADQGYVGAASAHLDTGFNPTTATSPNMASNNASVWGWSLGTFTASSDYGYLVGLADSSNDLRLYPHFSDNNFYFNINSTGFPGGAPQTGSFFGAVRTGATTSIPYQNTTAGTTDTQTQIIANADIWLINAGNVGPFANTASFAAFGASLSGAQEAAFYNRVHVYMQTVAGAP